MIPQYQKWKKIKNKKLHNTQWACLIIVCILLICAVHIQRLREIKWWKFEFWQWLALGFVGLAGRLVSGWGIKLLVISIEYNFLLKKRILFFIFGLRRSMKNSVWLGLILLTWTVVVQNTEDVSNTIPTVTKLLQCAFTGSTLWVVKVLLVKVLANSFHRSAYFERIQDSLFHQYILEVLSEPRSHRFARNAEKGADGRRRGAPVFKLRVAPSQKKLAPREAKKQGRIERQYSPTPTKFRVKKKLEARTPAWVTFSNTTNTTGNSWALKIPSLFPFSNAFTPTLQSSSSTPSSPNVMLNSPKLPAGTLAGTYPRGDSPATSSGFPLSIKGGSDPSAHLGKKSSLKKTAATYSRADSHPRLKVAFQDVVEEQNPNEEVVEASPSPAAFLGLGESEEVVIQPEMTLQEAEAIDAEMDLQSQEVIILPEMDLQEAEVIGAEMGLEAGEVILPEMVLQEVEVVDAEMGLQAQEVIQPALSLQEKEFQAVMDTPEKEEIQAGIGLREPAPPLQEVATVAAVPMSSSELAEPSSIMPIPAPTEPEKPSTFVAPDIEMEEDELENETGLEEQTTVAQDKIQILTKDFCRYESRLGITTIHLLSELGNWFSQCQRGR
ncbi:hypothetical protein KC19_4G011900 [Ceratodon purpureus]|uniref:Uncharacterized protein n=1 Tax=Ceratodon purpureus TaxID=3225 RepID=A0A8T0I791_CERPU|nr:hypothetical protein KC19_4G011900 [Ceratodon purpureus]